VLPRKRHWKRAYEVPAEDGLETVFGGTPPQEAASRHEAASGKVIVTDAGNRPAIYYRYALARDRLKMIPGLHRSGLDFSLVLAPAPDLP
jgi:hypothetical protein